MINARLVPDAQKSSHPAKPWLGWPPGLGLLTALVLTPQFVAVNLDWFLAGMSAERFNLHARPYAR
jgi:hypothetical protein